MGPTHAKKLIKKQTENVSVGRQTCWFDTLSTGIESDNIPRELNFYGITDEFASQKGRKVSCL